MAHHNTNRIPVLREGRILGIVTSREVLRSLRDPLPLPGHYLPLAGSTNLPHPQYIISLTKRVASLKILHLLKKIGEQASELSLQVYLVGGVVRDLLLDRSNLDMDIVVIGDAIPFAEQLQSDIKGSLRVFDRFRTARLQIEDLKIDFSSARIEHYAKIGALPQIEFSGLPNDLLRRDFTINTLALDLSPQNFMHLIDFFGGYKDIQDKKIKILHSLSFLEDPTRIFRAVRFAYRFKFELGEGTSRALDVALNRDAVEKLSPQRICAEICRIFGEAHPYPILQKLFQLGILRFIHPDLLDSAMLSQKFRYIPGTIRRFSVVKEPIEAEVLYWTGLLTPISPGQADQWLKDACYAMEKRKKVVEAIEALKYVSPQLSRMGENDVILLHKLLSHLSIEALVALVLFSPDRMGSQRVFYFLEHLRQVKSEISGKDLIEMGIPPGPHFGPILEEILQQKIIGRIKNRKEELEYVERAFKDIYIPQSK